MKIFAEILKRDDEKRLVFGYASTEALDSQGERVSKAAIEKALPDYMRFANVREMHQASAVGVTKSAEIDDKGLMIQVKVVDDGAWEKVKEGVYKGFSIGGKSIAKTDETITELKLTEISLVDRPANPEAVFDCWKADGVDGTEPDEKAAVKELAKLLDLGTMKPSEIVELVKRQFSEKERAAAADSGAAMKDGSFPIKTKSDLANAIKAFGRAKDKKAAKAHIIARAKALGATDSLPASWQKLDKAEGAEGIEKGMYTVSWLAGLLDTIACLQLNSAWEEETEGDGSAVPEQLRDWLAHGAEILCDMTDEEASELMGVARLPKVDQAMAAAEPAGDLAKKDEPAVVAADEPAAAAAPAAKAVTIDLLKIAEYGTKITELEGALAKRDSMIEALEKRLKVVEDQPAAPKGPTRAVGKGEDITKRDGDPAGIAPVLKADGTVDTAATEIKKLHAAGASLDLSHRQRA